MPRNVVAAGNQDTARAAAEVLREGGNAFDATIAALFMSFLSEPVLSSPGGGGFLLAKPQDRAPTLIDFFAQTPRAKKPREALDFRSIHAQFGTTVQEFHIGLGSIATPGMVAGLFDIHERYGSLPMARLAEPAIELARVGHGIDALQSHILEVAESIMMATPETREIYESTERPGKPLQPGEQHCVPDLADFLDELVREGPDLFYQGEVAKQIVACEPAGGILTQDDLRLYQVVERQPLEVKLGDVTFYSNPAPSSGGTLIGFSLSLAQRSKQDIHGHGSADWLRLLAMIMQTTNDVRRTSGFAQDQSDAIAGELFDEAFLNRFVADIRTRAQKVGGTTHISIADEHGNMASTTVSNGEGCGYIVPGTGFMLNNMLGEEDINPRGFFEWDPDARITSMMAPSLLDWGNGRRCVLGSGGSNRIRTALVQVIANLVWFGMGVREAVSDPRIHYENGALNIEAGFSERALHVLKHAYPDHTLWPDRDFYFGGVHVAQSGPDACEGAADERRAGVVVIV